MTAATRPHVGRSNVIVASHERSGTHFLINTLALNFGFAAKHVDSDIASGADFYIRSHFQTFLDCLRQVGSGRILKEHHHLVFFDGMLEHLREKFIVFYVYRNPADVMCSHWRYVRSVERREGPITETPGAFMRAAPWGGMLRYQMEQQASVLDRWRSHVDAWTTLGVEAAGAIPVVYEELNLDFEATVARLAARLGVPCPRPVRPSLTENVMEPGPGKVGGFRDLLGADDIAFIRQAAAPTLQRLGLDRYMSDAGAPA
jgi:hypothetical protein